MRETTSVRWLTAIDAQFMTPHLTQFGAVEISRLDYHRKLALALSADAEFQGAGPTAAGALTGNEDARAELQELNAPPPYALLRAMYGTLTDRYYGRLIQVRAQVLDVVPRARGTDVRIHAGRDLVSFAGPPIPIAPALDDAAIKRVIGDLPSTPLEVGVRETMRRFRELSEAGHLDTSDMDSEISATR